VVAIINEILHEIYNYLISCILSVFISITFNMSIVSSLSYLYLYNEYYIWVGRL